MNKKRLNLNSGYILAFALILTAITLTITLSVTKIISKELFFSSLGNASKKAYSAADAGLECAQYLDNTFKNATSGVSIILNSTSSSGVNGGQIDFENNLENTVFAKSALNLIFDTTNIPLGDSLPAKLSKIFCTSDGSYNQMFIKYALSTTTVKGNLESSSPGPSSSYNISGSTNSATTTFGLVIKDIVNDKNSCALIQYAKIKSNGDDSTMSFNIISTGYSSCNSQDKSRVSRTLVRYSTQ